MTTENTPNDNTELPQENAEVASDAPIAANPYESPAQPSVLKPIQNPADDYQQAAQAAQQAPTEAPSTNLAPPALSPYEAQTAAMPGSPYQQPQATPYAQPQATYQQPQTSPYGQPQGSPYVQQPQAMPYGQPQATAYGQTQANASGQGTGFGQPPADYATPPQGNPYGQAPAGQPYGYAPNQYGQAPYAYPYGVPQNPYAYPQQPPKKKGRGCLIAIIVALVVMMLSFTACVAAIVLIEDDYDDPPASTYPADDEDGTYSYSNKSLRSNLGLDNRNSGDPFSKEELDKIQSEVFKGEAKQSGTTYPAGVYFVGDNLKAGTYRIAGDPNAASHFYLLTKAKEGEGWDCTVLNTYYGNNLAEVSDGQVLIAQNENGFVSVDDASETFNDPYGSGVYRVGKDIPAGTYTMQPGKADDSYAYYVMSSLTYQGDYLDDYRIYYDKDDVEGITVTLEDGQYLELYNATLTKGKVS